MLTPEEQAAIDKSWEMVLAYKGRGASSEEAREMTLGLLTIFMHSAAGQYAIRQGILKREAST